jgi:hypothetical protein
MFHFRRWKCLAKTRVLARNFISGSFTENFAKRRKIECSLIIAQFLARCLIRGTFKTNFSKSFSTSWAFAQSFSTTGAFAQSFS